MGLRGDGVGETMHLTTISFIDLPSLFPQLNIGSVSDPSSPTWTQAPGV